MGAQPGKNGALQLEQEKAKLRSNREGSAQGEHRLLIEHEV